MKANLFLLIYILPLLIFSQNIDYSGEWTDSSPASTVSSIKIIPGEKFENTLTLKKIKNEENSYKFTFLDGEILMIDMPSRLLNFQVKC
jgi:hypothetical protein